jgi:hypothetical protein
MQRNSALTFKSGTVFLSHMGRQGSRTAMAVVEQQTAPTVIMTYLSFKSAEDEDGMATFAPHTFVGISWYSKHNTLL